MDRSKEVSYLSVYLSVFLFLLFSYLSFPSVQSFGHLRIVVEKSFEIWKFSKEENSCMKLFLSSCFFRFLKFYMHRGLDIFSSFSSSFSSLVQNFHYFHRNPSG